MSDALPGDILKRLVSDFGQARASELFPGLCEKTHPHLPNGTQARHLCCVVFLGRADEDGVPRSSKRVASDMILLDI